MLPVLVAAMMLVQSSGQQFDMRCHASYTPTTTQFRADEVRYSVDLTARRWCETQRCSTTTEGVDSFDANTVSLRFFRGADKPSVTLNRHTGELQIGITSKFQCVRAPYTPIQQRMF